MARMWSVLLTILAIGSAAEAGQEGTALVLNGKGVAWVAMFQYDRKTGRHIGTVIARESKLDAKAWTPLEPSCRCSDDKVLRLAFHLQGAIDLDDVSVTAVPKSE